MESLGNKLKTARESKGVTIDIVSRETNIAGRFLEALEQEDFSIFPGEPYILGFLRNYAAHLELDAEELLSLYRALKIQEQPVPVEQLLRSPSQAPKIAVGIGIGILALGLLGGIAWLIRGSLNRPVVESAPVRRPAEYIMNTDTLSRRFYVGDTVIIALGNDIYKLEFAALGDTISIATPAGPVRLDLSQEASVDLNNDGRPDLRIVAEDYAKNDAAAGALIRFTAETPQEPAAAAEAAIPELGARNGGFQAATVIFTSPSAYPFTLQASFQGYCLFRWEIIAERDRQGKNEQYFQRNDDRSIQAQNGIRLGISNAQAVRIQIIGGGRTVPLELGGAGEVVAAEVRWVRDEENRFRLVVRRLD